MWYRLAHLILAATQEEYLKSRGVQPDVINWYVGLNPAEVPAEHAKYVANALHKTPAMDLAGAQELLRQRMSAQRSVPTSWERAVIARYGGMPVFQKWVEATLRKQQSKPINGREEHWNYILPHDQMIRALDEMSHWWAATGEQISSYDWHQAKALSDRWHKMTAGQGDGLYYEPGHQERVVFGPQWPNHPEWEGWTMQSVQSDNDLKAEGKKLNHCVGNYCKQVAEGKSKIYSLRDPKNQPLVTLEIDGAGRIIHQIFAHSNSEPKEDAKAMLRVWFESQQQQRPLQLSREKFDDNYHGALSFQSLTDKNYDDVARNLEGIMDIMDEIEEPNHPDYNLPYEEKQDLHEILESSMPGKDFLESLTGIIDQNRRRLTPYHVKDYLDKLIRFYGIKDENTVKKYHVRDRDLELQQMLKYAEDAETEEYNTNQTDEGFTSRANIFKVAIPIIKEELQYFYNKNKDYLSR